MQRTNLHTLSVFCAILALVTILFADQSYAANDIAISATPAIVDTGGQPGQEIPFIFQLRNDGGTILPVRLATRDSRVREGQTEAFMSSISAKEWISFEESDFILVAGEMKEIKATLHIPESASPGGHYADIIVQSLTQEGNGTGITTQPELAVQLFVTVAGDTNEQLQVNSNSPSSVLMDRGGDRALSFVIENRGASHSLFTPKLQLENKKSQLVIESSPEILLPGEKKTVTFKIPNSVQLRIYSAQVRFLYGAPAKDATSSEIWLMILPFNPLLLLLLFAVPVGIYGYQKRSRLQQAVRVVMKGQ